MNAQVPEDGFESVEPRGEVGLLKQTKVVARGRS